MILLCYAVIYLCKLCKCILIVHSVITNITDYNNTISSES